MGLRPLYLGLVTVLGLLLLAGVTRAEKSAATASSSPRTTPFGPIKHFVVLMMENRAYDHMLGWLNLPGATGLTGNESNPWVFGQPLGPRIFVSKNATDEAPNPSHSILGTATQMYGTPNPAPDAIPNMQGFVMSGRKALGDAVAGDVMSTWTPERVPIISTLARNFALFDRYYASVPGPTYVNRLYVHSATSAGVGKNDLEQTLWGYKQKSIYQLLDEAGYDWKLYFGQVSDALMLQYPRAPKFWNRLRFMDRFSSDVRAGNLPTFTFLSPRWMGALGAEADDQHPAHAVSLGEKLIKDVYEAMRQSPLWNNTALLLTYDEHGGFYDHVSPPVVGIPNPDGLNCTDPPFAFNRLGPRIPTILISPWVDAQVIGEPAADKKPTPTSAFEHTSLIATLTRYLGLAGPLNKRDAWAAPWDYLLQTRSTPRTDCPWTLPPINQQALRDYRKLKRDRPEHLQPLDDLHTEMLQIANAASGLHPNENMDKLKTEEDAAIYVTSLMQDWITRNRHSHAAAH